MVFILACYGGNLKRNPVWLLQGADGRIVSFAVGFGFGDTSFMENNEKEIQILENISKSTSPIPQRDLASIIGFSLGMTNSILKRLAKKGLLVMKKVNNRNMRYAVTPRGLEEISRRSYRFFRQTIRNVVFYRETIEKLVADICSRGYNGLVLVGHSDLDFIVEHACKQKKIDFVRNDETYKGRLFYLYAESYIPEQASDENSRGKAFLQNILIDRG